MNNTSSNDGFMLDDIFDEKPEIIFNFINGEINTNEEGRLLNLLAVQIEPEEASKKALWKWASRFLEKEQEGLLEEYNAIGGSGLTEEQITAIKAWYDATFGEKVKGGAVGGGRRKAHKGRKSRKARKGRKGTKRIGRK